jgi:hypothetical protein
VAEPVDGHQAHQQTMNHTDVTAINLQPVTRPAGWELKHPKWLSGRKKVDHSHRGGSFTSESQVLKAAVWHFRQQPSLLHCVWDTHQMFWFTILFSECIPFEIPAHSSLPVARCPLINWALKPIWVRVTTTLRPPLSYPQRDLETCGLVQSQIPGT